MNVCPHCGKEIVTPVSADPVNAVGQPIFLPNVNVNAAAAPGCSTIVHGSHLWLNNCAAAQPGITFHYTVGDNDKR